MSGPAGAPVDAGEPVVPVLRPLRWWDLDAVVALERELFPGEPWSVEQWWAELAGVPRTRHYAVATAGATVVGYAGLLLGVDADEVLTVAVAPRAQGRGLGRALLRHLLAASAERAGGRAHDVLLEVRADDVVATGLYASEGFERVGVRRGYYAGTAPAAGRVDALVLRRVLRSG